MTGQTVRNPSAVIFTCPDHDRDTGHEIDIVNMVTGLVVQTISAGDPPADANGDVTVPLNVQPVAFGEYVIRARATFGVLTSRDSEPSAVWQRVPGQPGRPRL